MLYLTPEELFAYTTGERKKWYQWLVANPEAMSLPAQREGRFPTIGSLVDHIFLVERRHWLRLTGQARIIDETGVAGTDVAALLAFGERARKDLVHYARGLREDAATTVREFDCPRAAHRYHAPQTALAHSHPRDSPLGADRPRGAECRLRAPG